MDKTNPPGVGFTPLPVKEEVFNLLGNRCEVCGVQYHHAGLILRTADNAPRPKGMNYQTYMYNALQALKAGRLGDYKLWCYTCTQIQNWHVEMTPEPEPLKPCIIKFNPEIWAVGKTATWPNGFIFKNDEQRTYEIFESLENGPVYQINNVKPANEIWQVMGKVAESWEEFAALKGLPKLRPATGGPSMVVNPEGYVAPKGQKGEKSHA